jgi:hypothetical protein
VQGCAVLMCKADLLEHQDKMRQDGYDQAFVIAFNQGKRITIEQAKKLTQQ